MSCSLRAANINSPRSVPYPVPAHSRSVRSKQQLRARSVHSPYGFPPGRRSTAAPPLFAASGAGPRAPRPPRRPCPTGCPSCGSGPATPVVAMPQSAPSTRRTPAAICRATSASTAPRSASSAPSTPSTSRFSSVAYAVTEPRKARGGPGDRGELRGDQAAGQRLGDGERLAPLREQLQHSRPRRAPLGRRVRPPVRLLRRGPLALGGQPRPAQHNGLPHVVEPGDHGQHDRHRHHPAAQGGQRPGQRQDVHPDGRRPARGSSSCRRGWPGSPRAGSPRTASA